MAGFGRSQANRAVWAYRKSTQDLDGTVESLYTGSGTSTQKPWEKWPKIKKEHSSAQDIEDTNPLRGTSPTYAINCQRCVPAYEMRRRGYDVSALPAPKGDSLCEPQNLASMFDHVKLMRVHKGSGRKEIEKAMQLWGDGARAEVYIDRKDSGHVFVAEQCGGKTVFRDPQTGKASCREYFDDAIGGHTLFFRIDDAKVNDRIAQCCKEADAP